MSTSHNINPEDKGVRVPASTHSYSTASDNVMARHSDDEIDLRVLFGQLWQGRKTIVACVFVFGLIALLYSLTLPNMYKAEMTLAPANAESDGMGGALMGQLGGLASFAGVSLPGGSDSSTTAIATLESRQFLVRFIKKHGLETALLAREYGLFSRVHTINADKYDVNAEKWVRQVKPGKDPKPSDLQFYKAFSSLLNIPQDAKTGLVTLKVEWHNSQEAALWANALVKDLNELLRQKERLQAEKSIGYLENALKNTKLVNMQQSIFQLIESQLQTVMFADSKEEYAFSVIDPAVAPEIKAGPKRSLMMVLGCMLGLMVGFLWVLTRKLSRK